MIMNDTGHCCGVALACLKVPNKRQAYCNKSLQNIHVSSIGVDLESFEKYTEKGRAGEILSCRGSYQTRNDEDLQTENSSPC